MNNNKVKVQATMINGATGEKDIADMWKQHYSSLLTSSTDTSTKQEVIADLESLDIGEDYLFTTEDVQKAIDGLNRRKAKRQGWMA